MSGTDYTQPFDEGALVYLDAEGELLAQELGAIRDEQKVLKAQESKIRDELLARLNGAPRALTADGREAVTATVSSRRTVNRKRLEAMYPDVFDAVVDETEVVTVKITL